MSRRVTYPRSDPLGRAKFCQVCKIGVSASTKHCGACNKCVYGFDHHCIWLNSCIGVKFYRKFIIICTLMIVFSVSKLTIILVILLNLHGLSQTMIAAGIIQTVIDAGLLYALGDLMIFHAYLTCQGISTFEYIQRKRAAESSGRVITTQQYTEMHEVAAGSQTNRGATSGTAITVEDRFGVGRDQSNNPSKSLMSSHRITNGASDLIRAGHPLQSKDPFSGSILKKGSGPPVPFGPKTNSGFASQGLNTFHQRTQPFAEPSNNTVQPMAPKRVDDDEIEPEEGYSERDITPSIKKPSSLDEGSSKCDHSLDQGLSETSHDYNHNLFTALAINSRAPTFALQNSTPVLKTSIDRQLEQKKEPVQTEIHKTSVEKQIHVEIEAESNSLKQAEGNQQAVISGSIPQAIQVAGILPDLQSHKTAETPEDSFSSQRDVKNAVDPKPHMKELHPQTNPFNTAEQRLSEEVSGLHKEHVALQKASPTAGTTSIDGPSHTFSADAQR